MGEEKDPTLKDIKDDVATVKSKVESIIEIISRLEATIKRLEDATREIKGILPKEFITGATFRVRQ